MARAAAANPNLDTGTALGGVRAPDFRLTNQFGQPVSLSAFRGKVVILAFTDSECTTICPLTTASMVEAKDLLGQAGDQVQLLGIDANPQATSRPTCWPTPARTPWSTSGTSSPGPAPSSARCGRRTTCTCRSFMARSTTPRPCT